MQRARWSLLALSIVALCSMLGCGTPLSSAGLSCANDSDCAAGLTCLALEVASDAGCTALVKVCSKPCRADGDCNAAGAGFKCFASCSNDAGTCSRVQ
jgi:hypothetical protein